MVTASSTGYPSFIYDSTGRFVYISLTKILEPI
jgi:hypothetical protein